MAAAGLLSGPTFACRPQGAQARRPPLLNDLLAAPDGERVSGHVAGDNRPRPHIGAVADLHRRHQGRIGADEGALADLGLVLGSAVVIARDSAGADIRPGADPGVAYIAEVHGVRAGAELGR